MNLIKTASVVALTIALALSTISCKNKSVEKTVDEAVIKTGCQPGSLSLADATKQLVGTWKLVSIKSGWTGEIRKPETPLSITVDSQLKVKIVEDGKEVDQIQLNLSDSGWGISYKVVNRLSSTKGIHINQGAFSICVERLVLDNTAVDGPAYTFEKQK